MDRSAGEIFSKILEDEESCRRLMNVFYDEMEAFSDEHISSDPAHFSLVLLTAYRKGDITALLLELCGRSMFDLLRRAYLVPYRFHGKSGQNPVLLTTPEGEILPEHAHEVKQKTLEKLHRLRAVPRDVPRSNLYLADAYDLVRYYEEGMQVGERRTAKRQGILLLYALPDTAALKLTEAQAYAHIWDTFQRIQETAFSAMVFYGQETGVKNEGNGGEQSFDELGILLPLHEFEAHLERLMKEIDSLVLAYRSELRQLNDEERSSSRT